MKVEVVYTGKHTLPEYKTIGSAGMDLHANLDDTIVLEPLERALIPTGLHIALPIGYEAQVRPRSGSALNHGITVLNSPGTVDSDYRGEIGVILCNCSNSSVRVADGDRVAQLVIAEYKTIIWESVNNLDEDTARGNRGFGSTGQ